MSPFVFNSCDTDEDDHDHDHDHDEVVAPATYTFERDGASINNPPEIQQILHMICITIKQFRLPKICDKYKYIGTLGSSARRTKVKFK